MHGMETTQHKSEEYCTIHSKGISLTGQNFMLCVLLYNIYGERLLWVIDYGLLSGSGIWKGQNWWQIVFEFVYEYRECRNYSNNCPLEDIHSKGTLKWTNGCCILKMSINLSLTPSHCLISGPRYKAAMEAWSFPTEIWLAKPLKYHHSPEKLCGFRLVELPHPHHPHIYLLLILRCFSQHWMPHLPWQGHRRVIFHDQHMDHRKEQCRRLEKWLPG